MACSKRDLERSCAGALRDRSGRQAKHGFEVPGVPAQLGQGDAHGLACLFAEDAEWEVAGDGGALPWIGKKNGREAIVDLVRDTAALITRIRLDP